ncbi:MAG: cysteine desulfurase [Crocinitomicaceae bacterium]|jgi:cysteine desulfurase / selenocysteine lyase|nr:cysteine desulfurase [Crocinitomicaceae bacterium]MDP5099669.1 cysteine desulfurase [Crocinitomicaceae bacterium]
MKQHEVIAEFDVASVRKQFPTLNQTVYDKPLIYLDNGATSQKPQMVIDAIARYYTKENSNIHRGVHFLSQHATTLYEDARTTIQKYINAPSSDEVLFTSGTTGGINLVAFSFGDLLAEGDEIIISAMEHHSNIVPWQMLCERKKCVLKVIPININGELIMSEFDKLLSNKTKLVSVTHISNALGTINPVREIISKAHAIGAKVLIDGAQSIQHTKIDVQELDCDFFTFSGHKVFGPTGVGILYGKRAILDQMPPYQGGGDMIAKVTFEKTTYNELPHKFEAGTPNISGGIALGTAFEFLNQLDLDAVEAYETDLLTYAQTELLKIEGVRIIGTAERKTSVVSFVIDGLHPFDVGTLLDKQGIAVRTGHHCTQPVMDFFKIPGTIRASFAFYNTKEEVDILVNGLKRSISMLR